MIVETMDAAALVRDRQWWSIYEESIPVREREPRKDILRALQQKRVLVIRARQEERTIGLAMVHLLQDPPAGFLVYLAVDRAARGAGVGSSLFQYAVRESRQTLIWEVDPPSDDDSIRRIRFFEKHGAKLLDRPYVQPPLDGMAPVPMHLMVLPSAGSPDIDVEKLVQAIYREKYEAINGITWRSG